MMRSSWRHLAVALPKASKVAHQLRAAGPAPSSSSSSSSTQTDNCRPTRGLVGCQVARKVGETGREVVVGQVDVGEAPLLCQARLQRACVFDGSGGGWWWWWLLWVMAIQAQNLTCYLPSAPK